MFAKYIYQTPTVYLTGYRLNKSTELLKNTDMPMTEFAAVGFAGSSYYADAFRKRSEKRPSEYRKNAALNSGRVF